MDFRQLKSIKNTGSSSPVSPHPKPTKNSANFSEVIFENRSGLYGTISELWIG